jgi:hypothetical protein
MMASWTEIANLADPVAGNHAAFESAGRYWSEAANVADGLSSSFLRIVNGTADADVRGDTAIEVKKLMEQMRTFVDALPPVCYSLSSIMNAHATELAALRARAESARARAVTAWSLRNEASTNANTHQATVRSLRRQIDHLRTLPPDQTAEIQRCEANLTTATRLRDTAKNAAATQQSAIDAEVRVWREVHDQEATLNRGTADKLKQVHLGAIANPSNVEKFLTGAGRLFKGLGEGFVDGIKKGFDLKGWYEDFSTLAQAVFDGDLDAVLWSVKALIERQMALVSTLLMVAVVVVAVILAIPSGGSSLVAALAAIKAATLIYTAIASTALLAIDGALMVRGSYDPKTGRKMTWSTIGVDTIGVLLAAMGLKGLSTSMTAANGVGLAKYNAGRQVLKGEGIVLQHGYDVSAKKTAAGVVTQQTPLHKVTDLKQVASGESLEPVTDYLEEGAKQVAASNDRTATSLGPVDRDVARLLLGGRGLDATVEPYVVPTY